MKAFLDMQIVIEEFSYAMEKSGLFQEIFLRHGVIDAAEQRKVIFECITPLRDVVVAGMTSPLSKLRSAVNEVWPTIHWFDDLPPNRLSLVFGNSLKVGILAAYRSATN